MEGLKVAFHSSVPGDVISFNQERFKNAASGSMSNAVESFAWVGGNNVGKKQ
jgi:hypothetical protein